MEKRKWGWVLLRRVGGFISGKELQHSDEVDPDVESLRLDTQLSAQLPITDRLFLSLIILIFFFLPLLKSVFSAFSILQNLPSHPPTHTHTHTVDPIYSVCFLLSSQECTISITGVCLSSLCLVSFPLFWGSSCHGDAFSDALQMIIIINI